MFKTDNDVKKSFIGRFRVKKLPREFFQRDVSHALRAQDIRLKLRFFDGDKKCRWPYLVEGKMPF